MDWQLLAGEESGGGTVEPQRARPKGHTYSSDMISRAVSLVIDANNSFRGAAKALEICLQEDRSRPCPCPRMGSVRNWVLRLGLYELERSKARAADWAWIVDHTIQIGPHKALLVLGVRLSELFSQDRQDLALKHQDVRVLGLEICRRSNADGVLEILEKLAKETGVPRLLISDEGGDIKSAAGSFCERHEPTDWLPDASHRMARALEAELKGDCRWESFVSQAALCRNRCQQTALSALMPPSQRSKARWMNFKPLLTWGVKMLAHPIPDWAEARQFEGIFGWLKDYEDDLNEFWLMAHTGEEVCRIIKNEGIESGSLEQCRQLLEEMSTSERLERQIERIRAYLNEVESKLQPGERLIGSSDIIESVFGKYKLLVERSPQKAITELILSIGAVTARRAPSLIRKAMESVSMRSVKEWFARYIPQTPSSLRRSVFNRKGTNPA